MSGLEPLLARAFHEAPAREANEQISAQRNAREAGGHEALSYEVVLDAQATPAQAAAQVLPKLVYFLDCRGLSLLAAQGVFVSLFVADRLYFIDATDVVAELASAAGTTLEALKQKHGADSA